ncbi:MAG: hypothetical protein ACJ8GW_08250 [Massilia sp.]
MTHRLLIVATALALSACGNHPVQPAWQGNAGSALTAFSDAYLKGDTSIADTEFARARLELASTGRPDKVAHGELYRCATRTASLEFDHCPGFTALAQDATPAQQAYAAFLDGRWQGLDAKLLPEPQRALVQGKGSLATIADPLSRLVAAGVLMQSQRITPGDIIVATDTASSQGWRRPLLMWLGVALQRARAGGDQAGAARIERRIALASGSAS